MSEHSIKTIRLKVKPEAYRWLAAAAIEVNGQWNWAAEYSRSRIRNGLSAPSGFDLNNASAGFCKGTVKITADAINLINQEYALKRRAAKSHKLHWRVSRGPRRSLGWVPFKRINLKRHGSSFRYAGKTFRVFQNERLKDWRSGCFAQDACGDWWLCAPVDAVDSSVPAEHEAVGVDLGLKDAAVTSDGDRLSCRPYRALEPKIAQAQRRGHKRHAKRIHRKATRQRADALHKFSSMLVSKYQQIYVGDVSSTKLVKTRMAKSVLDAGWGMLRTQLLYKGQQAGRRVEIVNERNTTRACSGCGALTGPTGPAMLSVRTWTCDACGDAHDRDVNAARNILVRGKALPSVCGNEVQP